MSTDECIIALFLRVDAVLQHVPKRADAHLHPSAIATLALLFALKGVGPRAFYRWVHNNDRAWFPRVPERTRLFRLVDAHAAWAEAFLADPTCFGVIDSYGIEVRHPRRENAADRQIGAKGYANHRWIVGAKWTYIVNQYGLVVAWDYAAAKVHDTAFQSLIAEFQDEMIVLGDTGFHAAASDPPNLLVCQRGTRNVRMVIETVVSMLTTVCRLTKLSHRTWPALAARLGYTLALFNLLVQWDGFPADADGNVHLSIAQFSL
jgi:hypothetical protein